MRLRTALPNIFELEGYTKSIRLLTIDDTTTETLVQLILLRWGRGGEIHSHIFDSRSQSGVSPFMNRDVDVFIIRLLQI